MRKADQIEQIKQIRQQMKIQACAPKPLRNAVYKAYLKEKDPQEKLLLLDNLSMLGDSRITSEIVKHYPLNESILEIAAKTPDPSLIDTVIRFLHGYKCMTAAVYLVNAAFRIAPQIDQTCLVSAVSAAKSLAGDLTADEEKSGFCALIFLLKSVRDRTGNHDTRICVEFLLKAIQTELGYKANDYDKSWKHLWDQVLRLKI